MNQPEHKSHTLRLSSNPAGRVLLHMGTFLRSRRNLRWHLRCILRDLLNRPTTKHASAQPPPSGYHRR
jgi:hypothetical protein